MLRGYLKVREECPVCGEALHHHRAGGGRAARRRVVASRLVTLPLLYAFVAWRPDPLVLAAVFSVGAVALSLYLLPRLKGLMVAFQWAKRMHGFGNAV